MSISPRPGSRDQALSGFSISVLTWSIIYAENILSYIGYAGRVDHSQVTAADRGKAHLSPP